MDTRFGLLHLFESPAGKTEKQYYNENIELVEFADQCGLDEVWMAEHHFSEYGAMPSTQVMGSFIAARTKRIRIGTGVVVLPFHNPIRLAEEFAFLDQLSDGRLDFGVGRGYQPHEFEGYGLDISESRERFDESMKIIHQAWTEGRVTFKGKHYQFEGIEPRPRPAQDPHPPMFGASFNPETIKYQAMKRLNLLFAPLLSPPQKVDEYRNILAEAGEDTSKYRTGGLVFVYVDDDREQAYRDFEQPCMWYFRTFSKFVPLDKYPKSESYYRTLSQTMTGSTQAYESGQVSFKWMVEESPFSHAFLVGDPESVAVKLRHLLDSYRMSDVLCWTRLGGLAHAKVMNSMDLLVNKVLPLCRSAAAE